jgi:hypothetical protein
MMAKKTKKKSAKEPSWDEIGSWIGRKISRECEKKEEKWPWCGKPWPPKPKGHFFGALLFGIVLAVILNQQGILLDGVRWWLQALLVFGFALIFS